MSDDDSIPTIGEVLDMEADDKSKRRWLVLYDEDYDELVLDAEDQIALLVDNDQAVEILQLASHIVGDLAPKYAPDQAPIDAMIEALEEVRADE